MKLADDEWRRHDRWHATYNAAIAGLLSREQTNRLQSWMDCCAVAKDVADHAHGALENKP
jgi:hypothetical protein